MPNKSVDAAKTPKADAKVALFSTPGAIPASSDYAEVFPFVQAGFGFDDIVKAANFYKQYKSTFDSIFGFLKKAKKHTESPGTVPPPAPVVVVPVVVAPPVPNPVSGPLPYPGRIVSKLEARAYWIGRNDNPLDHKQFDQVISKGDPITADGHTKLHVDVSPFDQDGVEIGPGSPELNQLMRSDGHPAIVHHCTLDGNEALANGLVAIGSVDDDYGCTPSLKPAAEVRDGKDHEMVYWATLSNEYAPNRTANSPIQTIVSNRLSFRVK